MAFVQANGAFAQSPGGTTYAAPAMATTAGNTLIVAVRVFTAHLTSVTDTAGNTYVQAGFTDDGNTHLYVFYSITAFGHAANVVTGNFDFTVAGVHIIVQEESGITGGPFTKVAEVIGFADPTTSPAFDVVTANSLVFVAMQSSGDGGSWTPGSGYTERFEAGGVTSALAIQDRVALTTETGSTASALYSVAGFRSMMVVAFTLGAAPAPGPSPAPSTGTGLLIQMCFGGSYRSYLRNRP